ncbi:MAG TPA: glycosyltransferase family 2 protein [Gemmatimonadaceae bacterium]
MIAARNEAANIASCIASVSWAGEIIVVEDGSTDDTVALATAAGARVIHNAFTTIGLQRNAAIEQAREEWILVVDADERASPELGREVAAAIAAPRFDAYRVSRRNFFLGSEVRHGGWESDRPVRLFRRTIRYNANRVHEHVDVAGNAGDLNASLTHEPYPTLDSWFEKLGRYSRWWAEDRYTRGKRGSIMSVVTRPPLRFVTMYLIRGGWMDGARGAVLASMAATSVMAKYAQLWAMTLRRSR